jgi:uncharacterized protein (TIGR01777 family)
MTPAHRIVITGATGLIGRTLSKRLQELGYTVVPLRWRHDGIMPAQLEALEGAHAVIHLSGTPIACRWTDKARQSIRDSRVDSTRALAQALANLKARPHRFISMSGINRYGHRRPQEILTEASEVRDDGFLSQLCAEWEAATQPAQQIGIRTVQLRTGIVLAASGGALAQMLLPFKCGFGGPIGSGQQQLSWIRLGDLVELIVWALEKPDVQGPLNAVAPQPLTQRAFAQALARQLHRPSLIPLPAWAVKLLFGQMGEETLLADIAALPQLALQHGFVFRTPDLASALPLALRE